MAKFIIPEILLADDDIDDCAFFKDALEQFRSPTNLTTVRDGEQLMDYLNGTKDIPDALFLDLNIPRKNGYECLTEIRQNARMKTLPVVIISTSSEPDIIERMRERGAQHYICKPNDYSELVKVVHCAITIISRSHNDKQLNEPKMEDFVLTAGVIIQ